MLIFLLQGFLYHNPLLINYIFRLNFFYIILTKIKLSLAISYGTYFYLFSNFINFLFILSQGKNKLIEDIPFYYKDNFFLLFYLKKKFIITTAIKFGINIFTKL